MDHSTRSGEEFLRPFDPDTGKPLGKLNTWNRPDGVGHMATVSMADAIGQAGALSLVRGTGFGDNLLAALPSAIGNTIGNAIANGIGNGILDGRAERLANDESVPEGLRGTDEAVNIARQALGTGASRRAVGEMLASMQPAVLTFWENMPLKDASAIELSSATLTSAEQSNQPLTSQQIRRLQNEFDLTDPRVLAFLDVLSFTEGAEYNTLFGGGSFDDFSTHPGHAGARYRGQTQSAAGRYQIQLRTFGMVSGRIGDLDFSPHSQDLIAVDLIRGRGAMSALQSGDLATAVTLLSWEWASLPYMSNDRWQGSRYNQPVKAFSEIQTHYAQRLQYHSTLEQAMMRILTYSQHRRAIIGQ